MVHGANRSGSRKKVFRRTTTGTVEKYVEKRPSAPRCISGRPLPGTARGTKVQIKRLGKTERRPSRPYGGVLSAPVMREGLRTQAQLLADGETSLDGILAVGRVCMKIAGRDAGRFCVILGEKDGKYLIDGQTRRRYVSSAHIEPLLMEVSVKKDASSQEVAKALEAIDIEIAPAPSFPEKKKSAKPAKKVVKADEKKTD